MEISQYSLLLFHLGALFLGGGLGLLYDLLRWTRVMLGMHYCHTVAKRLREIRLPLLKPKKDRRENPLLGLLIFFEDLLFCMFSGAALILLFYRMNNGNIRITALLCAGLGFLLYRALLGKLITPILEIAAFLTQTVIRYFALLITYPLLILLRFCKKIVLSAYKRIWQAQERQHRVRYTALVFEAANVNACGMIPEKIKHTSTNKKGKRYDKRKEKTIQSKLADAGSAGRHSGSFHRHICK